MIPDRNLALLVKTHDTVQSPPKGADLLGELLE